MGKGSRERLKGKLAHLNDEPSETGSAEPLRDSSTLCWSEARLKNALDRDFTVNALMYDPFSRIVFDYTNGIEDCR